MPDDQLFQAKDFQLFEGFTLDCNTAAQLANTKCLQLGLDENTGQDAKAYRDLCREASAFTQVRSFEESKKLVIMLRNRAHSLQMELDLAKGQDALAYETIGNKK